MKLPGIKNLLELGITIELPIARAFIPINNSVDVLVTIPFLHLNAPIESVTSNRYSPHSPYLKQTPW